MHQIFAHSSLATPNTMLAKFPIDISVVKREIGFPLVIKNVTGTQGSGIYLCESEEKFIDVMELVYSNNNKANIILQEFIETGLLHEIYKYLKSHLFDQKLMRFSSKTRSKTTNINKLKNIYGII